MSDQGSDSDADLAPGLHGEPSTTDDDQDDTTSPRRRADGYSSGHSTDYAQDGNDDDSDASTGLGGASEGALNFDDLSDDAEGSTSLPVARPYTDVGSYETYEAARSAVESWHGLLYLYDTRYETSRLRARVYVCRSHVSCEHRLKITTTTNPDGSYTYVLAEAERHGDEPTSATRRGIHPQLRAEVDSLLQLGLGGQELRNVLDHRYQNDPVMAALLPSARQLTNRKAYLSRNSPGGWDLRNFASFNAWAGGRLCTSREAFDTTDLDDARMDEMIILDSFVYEGETPDVPTTFGVVVSSRRVFRNVLTSVRDQGRELVLSTDGTYKLHFGGWTVVDCGSVGVTWSRQAYTHRFIPWLYMFVRTESTDAYLRMFEAVSTRARDFFGIEVNVAFGSMDHSDAIASAFEAQ